MNNPTPPPAETLVQQSIQQDSLTRFPTAGGLGGFGVDNWLLQFWNKDILPIAPWWSSRRDLDLRRYVRHSVILSGIVNSRILAVKNMSYTLEATDKRAEGLLPYYNSLFNTAQFQDGFRSFMGLWATDLHTQDNGAFIEWIGPGGQRPVVDSTGQQFIALGPLGYAKSWEPLIVQQAKAKAAIQGFAHLDAGQVWRTMNAEYPVIYRNAYTGKQYILHRSRVSMSSQFTQPSEFSRGIGYSAVSRALWACEVVQAAHQYTYEKMTGGSPEIGLLKGVSRKSVQDAVTQTALDMDANGRAFWKSVMLINTDAIAGIDPDIKLIGIKSVPDGWDKEKEIDMAIRFIAMAFATTTRELGWSTGTTGATKADAEVQHLGTAGQGREECLATLEQIINTRLLPRGISFEFDVKDDLEDRYKAEIAKMSAEARAIRIQAGEITTQEARELAAREGQLPSEFMDTQTVLEDDSSTPANTTSPVDDGLTAPPNEKSIRTYERTLKNLVNQYRAGKIDKLTFKRLMRNEIEKQFELAWRAGARVVKADPNTDEAYAELERLIEEELTFVQQFADSVEATKKEKAITLEDIRRRVGLWANRFLEIKNRAMAWLGMDIRLKWKHTKSLRDHEACTDCLVLDGWVLSANEWKRLGVFPQDRRLQCKGYKCDCELVVTTEAITRDTFPQLSFEVD